MDAKTQELHIKVRTLRDELKSHANVVQDEKCAVLCETAGEVLGGVEEAFDHYINKSEKAWQ